MIGVRDNKRKVIVMIVLSPSFYCHRPAQLALKIAGVMIHKFKPSMQLAQLFLLIARLSFPNKDTTHTLITLISHRSILHMVSPCKRRRSRPNT